MKWEYDVEFITGLGYLSGGTGSEPFTVKQVLNRRGADGWELISHNEEGWGIFKRMKLQSLPFPVIISGETPKVDCACNCMAQADAEEAAR